MLREAGVTTLVDVRARPVSRRHPQFAQAALRAALARQGMSYHWAGRELGGLRPARAGSPHTALPEGLRGFADYMEEEAFVQAARDLEHLAARAPAALLCAERDPAQCHRGLLADYLTLRGAQVVHLLVPGTSRPHVLHPAARRESAALVYDRGGSGVFDLDESS